MWDAQHSWLQLCSAPCPAVYLRLTALTHAAASCPTELHVITDGSGSSVAAARLSATLEE